MNMTNKCDILNAELFQDELMPKTLGALSVYDLMGMDCSIYVKKITNSALMLRLKVMKNLLILIRTKVFMLML